MITLISRQFSKLPNWCEKQDFYWSRREIGCFALISSRERGISRRDIFFHIYISLLMKQSIINKTSKEILARDFGWFWLCGFQSHLEKFLKLFESRMCALVVECGKMRMCVCMYIQRTSSWCLGSRCVCPHSPSGATVEVRKRLT